MQPNSNFGTNIQSVMNSTTPTQGGMYQVEKSSTPVGYEKIYYPPGKTPDPSLRYPGAPPASSSNPSWTPPTQSVTPPSSPTQTSATPKTTLRQIIDYSKANPNTDYAKRVGQLIQSGDFDAEAQKEGIDLSWAGRPPLQKQNSTTQPMQSTNPIVETAQNLGGQYNDAINKIESSVEQGAAGLQKAAQDPDPITGIGDSIKALGETGLGTDAGAVQAIFAPISAPIQTLIQHLSAASDAQKANGTPGITDNILNSPQADAARKAISDWSSAHPELARTLGDAFTVGTAALGSGEEKDILNQSVSDVAKGAFDTAKKAVSNVKDMVVESPEAQAAKASQTAIDAVNPDLTGKKLVGAYKEIVTGKRTSIPSGVLSEGGLSPNTQAISLGQRLSDIPFTKDPVKNLNLLAKDLTSTETKIDNLFKTDPEVQFNADKPTLLTKLDSLKTQIPREFSAIKDSKNVFNNVIDFAKETIVKAEDTPQGLRTARTAFDNQAKLEYPNAFKDGAVDVKTPAGRAIKLGRDTINTHLYDTAPKGTEIKQLIGREADIYRATDNIAPKATELHGLSKVQQFAKAHPILTKVVAGTTAYEAAKGIGVPIP